MPVLKALEAIRFPTGDTLFSLVTHLGEETIFMVVCLILLWCINKKEGFYLFAVGMVGTVLNQFMKIVCRVPRPWVLDPEFTIVESARAEATGYSFPSGHSQSAVGVFGGIARWEKHKLLRILCLLLCLLVPFSRLYLGVHTPQDVLVGALSAAVLVLVLYPLFHSGKTANIRMSFAVMTMLSVGYLLYVQLATFPADVDAANLAHAQENGFKMLGGIIGIWMGWEADERWLHFPVKAAWWVQILKVALGLVVVLAVQTLLKKPLRAIMPTGVADMVRYLLLAVAGTLLWPMTFSWFAKLGKKN